MRCTGKLVLGNSELFQNYIFINPLILNLRLFPWPNYDSVLAMPDGIQFLYEVRKKFGFVPFSLFTGRGREKLSSRP